MATINLTISAEDPQDLHEALAGLVALFDSAPEGDEPVTARTVLNEIKSEGGVPGETAEAPKRGRRGRPAGSKNRPAEVIAADKDAAEAAKVAVDPAQTPITPAEQKDAAPVATIGALPPTEKGEEAPTATVTLDHVREALKVLVDAKGGDAARGVLREQGFEKLSDLPEQMYGDVIKKAQAAAVVA